MKVRTSLLLLSLVVAVTNAQYNYQPSQQDDSSGYDYNPAPPPRNQYLPPTERTTPRPYQPPPPPPPTTKNPYESTQDVAAEGSGPNSDGWQEGGSMPFDFTYAVKDDYGNDFSHMADSDGEVIKGEYKTLLPDGRTQIVRYTADWKNGYNAEVTYEGEAVYPEEPVRQQPTRPPPPPPTRPPPPPPPRPQTTTRDPYLSETDNDSQGLYPSTTRAPYIPPPTTTRAPYRPPPPAPTTQRYVPPPTRPPYVPPPTTTRPPYRPQPTTTQRYIPPPPPPTTYAPYVPPPTTTQRYIPPPQPSTYAPYVPPPTYRTTTRAPYVPPPTTTRPPEPPGLYGAPSVPFGVRNNPKFGYSRK
jgi:hypothetical protein